MRPSFLRSAAPQGRRSFLGAAGVATLGLLGLRTADGGPSPEEHLMEESLGVQPRTWDLRWVDDLKGKHKQVFDVGSLAESPVLTVSNYLLAMKEVYGLEHPQVNTVVGIAFNGFPLNASDELWERFPIGERWKVTDPATGTWARRNVFVDPPGPPPEAQQQNGRAPDPDLRQVMQPMMAAATLRSVKARGTVFWQCNNALNGVAAQLTTATNGRFAEVRRTLLAGLYPDVHLVPAHTMMLGVVQEKGCTYERL